MSDNPAFTQALQDLGMTRTESEVYLATLQTSVEEPVSGYKVAQVMGRDPANLSKTLAHLVKVGAVRLVQARPRHYVGVPVAEFTEMLMARMEESREKAITLMASLGSNVTTQQPTPLENTSHILAQARRILSQSRGEVVLCCDDKTLLQLEEFLEDMGRNFPDQAVVLTDSPKMILGIKIYSHGGALPVATGFADNTTESWILITAQSGQWLSAFHNFDDSSEQAHGWVGSNHEISQPFKSVITALLDQSAAVTMVNKSTIPAETPEIIPESNRQVDPEDTQGDALDDAVDDVLSGIQPVFEPGAIANTADDADEEIETSEIIENEEPPKEDLDKKPSEGGFTFLVQHDDDEDEDEEDDLENKNKS